MIKGKPGVLLESHLESHLHIELFRPERKVRIARGETRVNRPDDRYPGHRRTEPRREKRKRCEKSLKKVLTQNKSMIE